MSFSLNLLQNCGRGLDNAEGKAPALQSKGFEFDFHKSHNNVGHGGSSWEMEMGAFMEVSGKSV